MIHFSFSLNSLFLFLSYYILIYPNLSILTQAIEKLKANAAALNRPNNAKTESVKELPNPNSESSRELNDISGCSSALPKHQSSTLPPDFFDDYESKKQRKGKYLSLVLLSNSVCVKLLVEQVSCLTSLYIYTVFIIVRQEFSMVCDIFHETCIKFFDSRILISPDSRNGPDQVLYGTGSVTCVCHLSILFCYLLSG